jgi:TatD DNase family protein
LCDSGGPRCQFRHRAHTGPNAGRQLLPWHSPAVCPASRWMTICKACRLRLEVNLADPRLVAVGEIGLDYFVPELCESPLRERQEIFLPRATQAGAPVSLLPVVLHVRRSADRVLKHLRDLGQAGAALAWNCPCFQWQRGAGACIHQAGVSSWDFGGAVTFETCGAAAAPGTNLAIWTTIVLETDFARHPTAVAVHDGAGSACGHCPGPQRAG